MSKKGSLVIIALFLIMGLSLLVGKGSVSLVFAGPRSNCWMTGGGSIFETNGDTVEYGSRITHGFVLHCDPRNSDSLEVNDHGTGWSFHLQSIPTAVCTDDPNITPNPPNAQFDTLAGTGSGVCRSAGGDTRSCTAEWLFTDGGEPGGCVRDTAMIVVTDSSGNILTSVSGDVDCGNNQAHSQ